MARRSTIGANPLDAVGPHDKPKRAGPQEQRPKKERATFQLPVELIERARDAVFFSPGLTMSSLMETALVAQLERVEKKHGKPFPSRSGAALRTGRPVKVA